MIRTLFFFITLLVFSGCSFSNQTISNKKELISEENYALHKAVRANNIELVKELISKNININKKDLYGYTPLHLAVRFNYFDIAKELIDNGADVNTIDIYKDTPLLDSTRSGYSDISKLLICSKADAKFVDSFNKSALDYALLKNDEIILSLLKGENLQESCKEKEELFDEVEEQIIDTFEEENFNQLSISLSKLFPNLKTWNANYNKNTQTFTFKSKNIFQNGNLSEEYKRILNEFFPKYIEEVLKYKEKILNIYIDYSSSKKELLILQNDADKVFEYMKKLNNKTIRENIIWIEKNFFSDGVVLEKGSFDKLEFKVESISN